MLAALLLAGIVAAPLGSAGLFARARQRDRVTGSWAAARRFALALAGTAVLAAAAGGPTLGMTAAPFNSWAAQRATLPVWLRERRQTEYRRDRRAFARARPPAAWPWCSAWSSPLWP